MMICKYITENLIGVVRLVADALANGISDTKDGVEPAI